MQYVQGTLTWSTIPGPWRSVRGEIPRVEVRKVLIISPILRNMIREIPDNQTREISYPCHVRRSAAA